MMNKLLGQKVVSSKYREQLKIKLVFKEKERKMFESAANKSCGQANVLVCICRMLHFQMKTIMVACMRLY